eukprot:6456933-Amphidinium_carterae.1
MCADGMTKGAIDRSAAHEAMRGTFTLHQAAEAASQELHLEDKSVKTAAKVDTDADVYMKRPER